MTDQRIGRVWRLWCSLGLNLPKRRRRKLHCRKDIRILGVAQSNGVWVYGLMHDRLANGATLELLCVLNEHTQESMMARPANLRIVKNYCVASYAEPAFSIYVQLSALQLCQFADSSYIRTCLIQTFSLVQYDFRKKSARRSPI